MDDEPCDTTFWAVVLVHFAVLAIAWCYFCSRLVVATARGAPAPPPRVKAPLEVVPGEYVLCWGTLTGRLWLHANENQRSVLNASEFYGTWHWDRKIRTLRLMEQNEGGSSWQEWTILLDGSLAGKSLETGVMVSLRRAVAPTPAPK